MRIAFIAATAFAAVPMMAMAQEPAKDEATVVGGRVRVTNKIMDTNDKSKSEHYAFDMDRARLWFSRTVKGVETNLQFRYEGTQNGADNDAVTADTLRGVNINRAYINFKDVAPGLNLQVGKHIYKFGDDADYGLEVTDAQKTFAVVNSGYGLGLFADYKIPGDMGTAHIAVTNGNGKSYTDGNSQKAFVSYFKIAPMAGIGLNLGWAVNTVKSVTETGTTKNVGESFITVGATTAQELTFVNIGVEYNMKATKRDGKYYDAASASGSGIAARIGYKLDDLKIHAVYNMLQKTYEVEQAFGYMGGILDSKTKTPKGSSFVTAAEYTVGSAIVGAQYKVSMNDAKFAKDKNGTVANKSASTAVLYTQVNF